MSDRQYELVYILPPDTTEQQATDMHDQVQSIVSRTNGRIEKTDVWGRRKLAYEIGPHKEGFYVLEVVQGSGDLVKELDRRLKVIDTVIRHLIVRVDEEKQVVERTRSKRQASSERRRVRRRLPPQRPPGVGRPPRHGRAGAVAGAGGGSAARGGRGVCGSRRTRRSGRVTGGFDHAIRTGTLGWPRPRRRQEEHGKATGTAAADVPTSQGLQ